MPGKKINLWDHEIQLNIHHAKSLTMANNFLASVLCAVFLCVLGGQAHTQGLILDETSQSEEIVQRIVIDSVWAGHRVRFCLYTHGERQYIAYYNADRSMVVGQRDLDHAIFEKHIMPRTTRAEAGGTSTVLGWDSHNSITMAIDKEGYIHLSGNMHAHPMTYFRSTKPHDISTLSQHMTMVGPNEQRCTYPKFMLTKQGELIFHYRDGGSGNGNEIYNIYSCEDQRWRRMLDVPLTDGQGRMNAYQTQPTLHQDGWYHVYWVWRDTPDCETNHDLSYMKSPDLQHWFDAFGQPISLPATLDQASLIVDPIPPKGGIINLAAKLCLDANDQPVFAYHKYDDRGNLQLYTARLVDRAWIYTQITDWDYRWEFSGRGSINVEVRLKDFRRRADHRYEVDFWHIKYGHGTILLDDQCQPIGRVKKAPSLATRLAPEGSFPGLRVLTASDLGRADQADVRFLLKWEALGSNRDRPRPKPWPAPSILYLYQLTSSRP